MDYLMIGLCALTLLAAVITLVIVLLLKNKKDNTQEIVTAVRHEMTAQQSVLRQELTAQTQTSVKNMGDMLLDNQRTFSQGMLERMSALEEEMKTFSLQKWKRTPMVIGTS